MKIQLATHIRNSPEVCFNLSRSIDLHKISTAHTNEEAIAGCTSGLIEIVESVTWRAKHLGLYQKLTTKITEMDFPHHFRDEQIKGPFKSMVHDHYFTKNGSYTIMKDVFEFRSPFGVLGRLADGLVLRRYMTGLLLKRNETIKMFAETERWRELF